MKVLENTLNTDALLPTMWALSYKINNKKVYRFLLIIYFASMVIKKTVSWIIKAQVNVTGIAAINRLGICQSLLIAQCTSLPLFFYDRKMCELHLFSGSIFSMRSVPLSVGIWTNQTTSDFSTKFYKFYWLCVSFLFCHLIENNPCIAESNFQIIKKYSHVKFFWWLSI